MRVLTVVVACLVMVMVVERGIAERGGGDGDEGSWQRRNGLQLRDNGYDGVVVKIDDRFPDTWCNGVLLGLEVRKEDAIERIVFTCSTVNRFLHTDLLQESGPLIRSSSYGPFLQHNLEISLSSSNASKVAYTSPLTVITTRITVLVTTCYSSHVVITFLSRDSDIGLVKSPRALLTQPRSISRWYT